MSSGITLQFVRLPSPSTPPGAQGATGNGMSQWLAILAPYWCLIGAAGAAWLFVLSTSPFGDAGVADPFSGLQDPPAWTRISSGAGSWIDVVGAVAFLPWLLVSVPVLILGLRCLSAALGRAIWWKVAWTCAVGAGVVLAVLIDIAFNYPPPYISSARAVSWGELAVTVGFLLLAIIMWLMMWSLGRAIAPSTRSSCH